MLFLCNQYVSAARPPAATYRVPFSMPGCRVHGSMDEKGLWPHNPEPLIQLVFTQEGEIEDAGMPQPALCYSFFHSGFRFSRNAFNPSWASAVFINSFR